MKWYLYVNQSGIIIYGYVYDSSQELIYIHVYEISVHMHKISGDLYESSIYNERN